MVSGFFTRKITQVASVGDVLEQRRLSLGIALERVSRETQIQARYLRALELGDATSLPPELYVRGFLRTYARYLRLDADALTEQWNRERGISKHLRQQKDELPAGTVAARQRGVPRARSLFRERRSVLPRIRITPTVFKFGLVGLAVVALGLYFTLSVTTLARPPELVLQEPTSDQAIDSSSIIFVGKTSPNAQLTINEQPVHVAGDGSFRETLSLQQGVNEIVVRAQNKLGRESLLTRRIQANLSPISAATSDRVELASSTTGGETAKDSVGLTVTVHEEATWLEIEADGNVIFDGTLLPEVTKEFTAKDELLLTTGKAQYTQITFNGDTLHNLGEGVLRRVSFTPGMTVDDLPVFASR